MIIRRALFALFAIYVLLALATPATADTTVSDIYLLGPGGTGGTTTVSPTTSSTGGVGSVGTANTWRAQSFSVNSGIVSQISIRFGASTGSPTGTMTWEIRSENISIPGTVLASGTFTPAASTNQTVDVSAANLFVFSNTTYWLLFKSTATQATSNFWTVTFNTIDVYANGQMASTTDGGSSWQITSTSDLQISVTTVLGSAGLSYLNDKVAQSFTVGGYVTAAAVKLYLKKFNSPTGTITLNIESDTGNNPSGYLIDPDATGTLSESSLTTSYGLATITLNDSIELQPNIKYWLVVSTDRATSTDYVALGATSDCVVDTYLKVHNQGVWKAESNTGIFEFTLDSTPIQASSSASFYSLADNKSGQVVYTATAGELGIIAIGVGLLGLAAAHYLRKGGDNAGS